MTADNDRYVAPPDPIVVFDSDSDLHAILQSVSQLLSEFAGCHSVALLLLNGDGQSARLHVLELGRSASISPLVRDILIDQEALAGLRNGPEPRYIAKPPGDLADFPELLALIPLDGLSGAHLFRVSSGLQHPGILFFVTRGPEWERPRSVELMRSATVLISKFLDTALAFAAAESYKQTLARERDRWKLLLEINNHTIAHLEMGALFRAASKSLHTYFDNAFTGFWLFEEKSSQLELSTLEFPRGLGFRENTTTAVIHKEDLAAMEARMAAIFGPQDIDRFPPTVARAFSENGIRSIAFVPLVGTNGVLGAITLGSKIEIAFNQDDLELLSQIANQISLALDNALAYRRIKFSCRRLEEERNYLQSEFQSQNNFEDIVGQSAAIMNVLEQASIVAPTG